MNSVSAIFYLLIGFEKFEPFVYLEEYKRDEMYKNAKYELLKGKIDRYSIQSRNFWYVTKEPVSSR